MSKKRTYIPVEQNLNKHKIYLDDVLVWKLYTKKRTPKLPAYEERDREDDCQPVKWEDNTEV